jgi:hypothetical protein
MTADTVGTTPRWWQRWPDWVGYAAATWSLLYGVLGMSWALGGAGFPFGRENDPQAALSILEGAQAATGGPIIAALGLVGAVLAVVMARTWGRGILRAVMLVFAWTAAAAPIFLLGAPFGWPPASFFDVITWPVVNQFVCIAGGLCWAGTALAYQRRSRDTCANCGRAGDSTDWTTPVNAARWGKWAVAVAVIIPLLYAATRWAWALGIPLGISEEFFREGQAVGLWWAGAALATVAISGALLTLGLVQRWGEVFPRWLPILAGKRVPPALVIVPASLVSILVTTAGLMFVRLTLRGAISESFTFIDQEDWAALAPELLWPLWGVALAAATLAYYYRRRGTCARCGRG